MITFDEVIRVLADVKLPNENKMQFILENELNGYDLTDVANYVTIERNFYKRRCERLAEKGGQNG